ncbi:GDP-mannose transporter into the lumen of the Golgi [Glugoides intestinalis]
MKEGLLEKAIVISLYLTASTAVSGLNKFIITSLNFQMHYFLIILQSTLIVFIVLAQSLVMKVSLRYSTINRWWITSILLATMMFTGMKAIFYIPLSLFTLYKNFSIVLTALLEMYFFNLGITMIGWVSFFMMITSSFYANTVDAIDHTGHYWMIANVFSTSAYVLYLKKLMVLDMSTRTESVFFTNLLSIPILSVLSLKFDQFEVPDANITILATCIILSSIAAYFTSFSTAWSMKILSSTSYSMLGSMNKLIISASGFLIFQEKIEKVKLISIMVGIFSGMIYSLDSIKRRQQEESF